MKDQAIFKTYPNVISYDEEHGCFDKNGNLVKIDESLVETKIQELQAEYDSKQYQRDRAEQYPSIPDQLDTIYHQGLDAWKAEIKAVKDAHPKPT